MAAISNLDLRTLSNFLIRSSADNRIVAFLKAPNDFYVSGLQSFINAPEELGNSFKVNISSKTMLYIDNQGILHYKLGLFNENKPLQGATSISAGDDYTCAISNNNLYCWGLDSVRMFNYYGPFYIASGKIGFSGETRPSIIGDCVDCFASTTIGMGVYSAYKVALPGSVQNVSLGRYHTCAISSNNLYCWGLNSSNSGSVFYAMKQRECSLGFNPITPSTTPLSNILNPSRISSGDSYSIAVSNNNILKRWGGKNVQIGQEYGTFLSIYADFCGPSNTPNSINSAFAITDIASGKSSASVDGCYVANSRLYCWNNANLTPIMINSGPLSNGISRVVFGESHACAIASGSVYCWGANNNYQLASSTISDASISSPVLINLGTGVSVVDISAGDNHTCVVLSNGLVKCWGKNWYGEIGAPGEEYAADATSSVITVPLITNATKVAAGKRHTCAIISSDTINYETVSNVVKCWGAEEPAIRGNGINCVTGTFNNWNYNNKHPEPSYVTIPTFYTLP